MKIGELRPGEIESFDDPIRDQETNLPRSQCGIPFGGGHAGLASKARIFTDGLINVRTKKERLWKIQDRY
jgi:hypothetical protein